MLGLINSPEYSVAPVVLNLWSCVVGGSLSAVFRAACLPLVFPMLSLAMTKYATRESNEYC